LVTKEKESCRKRTRCVKTGHWKKLFGASKESHKESPPLDEKGVKKVKEGRMNGLLETGSKPVKDLPIKKKST